MREMAVVERVLVLTPGYVLNFSDRTFAQFFGEFDVDIDSPKYRTEGTSKAYRLRSFLRQEPDQIVGGVLASLLKHRIDTQGEPSDDDMRKFSEVVRRLGASSRPNHGASSAGGGSTLANTTGNLSASPSQPRDSTVQSMRDTRSVFIIYGRNVRISGELSKFLLSVGLRPLTFQEARRMAGAQPSVYEVVKCGVSSAQAVIALFTPDEWVSLAPEFRSPTDRPQEVSRWHARPNVPFEAGLAMGLNPDGTILATFGPVEMPSDIAGLHQFRLSNEASSRHNLMLLLERLGCAVNRDGTHHLGPEAGDFSVATITSPADPFVPK